MLDAAGAHLVDFTPVEAAIGRAIPDGTRAATGCAATHLAAGEVVAAVQELKAECHACGWVGSVTAHFRLKGAIAEAVDVRYTPEVAQ